MLQRISLLVASVVVLLAIPANAAKMEFVPVTASGPHSIRGNEIVLVGGGQKVTLEIRISNWNPDVLHIYQVHIDTNGFVSGDVGTAFPLGWDRDFEMQPCQDDSHCPGGQVCHLMWERCAGPDHYPQAGWFMDTSRPDYVFQGIPSFVEGPEGVDYLEYRLGDLVMAPGLDPAYAPPPKYGGTLILAVSEDARGTFTIDFVKEGLASALFAPGYVPIEPLQLRPILVTVTEPGCGNRVCEFSETCLTCPDDCSRVPRVRTIERTLKSASPGSDSDGVDEARGPSKDPHGSDGE